MELKRGDLVRWVIDHDIYESDGDVLRGVSPNYKYGIIMEVSGVDPNAVIIFSYDDGGWTILNLIHDSFEVLSGGAPYG
jgi:hypothetical protein|tara:strand:+ start:4251 stop:4487 length:237 start_codon:yes stop_codon:yes gene_type:complete